ncbi:MAG: nucleotidyltransferase family protein, partial [Lachnospiraceae bacterium]|nr:nucleotidyltransferase family protein [Lachnospiraceae bacterium]
KRTDNGYSSMETTKNFASATKIRSLFEEDMESVKKFVPENIFELLNINYTNGQTVTANNLSHILNYVLRTSSLEELKAISPVFEEDIYDAISMETCVNKRLTIGAPGKEAMEKVIALEKEYLAKNHGSDWLKQ